MEEDIREAFNIPDHKVSIYKTKEEALKVFEDKLNACISVINNEWLVGPRTHHSKLPKLTKSDLQEEFGDLIILLS